jgi:hypothetical protein
MLNITIKTQAEIRNADVGDWQFQGQFGNSGPLEIRVKELYNANAEFLIALHELVEAWLCRNEQVDQKSVDEWDANGGDGDQPDAPYYRQHQIATNIERIVATELGLLWSKYEELVEANCGNRDQETEG